MLDAVYWVCFMQYTECIALGALHERKDEMKHICMEAPEPPLTRLKGEKVRLVCLYNC